MESFEICNTEADAIPPFGLCEASGGFSTGGALNVGYPSADSKENLIVNGPFTIAPGGFGLGSLRLREVVAFNYDDGVPATGDTIGSVSGSFLAKKNNTGFTVFGGVGSGIANAYRTTAVGITGSGTDHHVPRWNGTDALEDTAVTIGSAGFSTVDSALCVYYPAATIGATTPFILLDPEVSFIDTASQISFLGMRWATRGVGTGVYMEARSVYPFATSDFLVRSVESAWRLSFSGTVEYGYANFLADPTSLITAKSNALAVNVVGIKYGTTDTSNPELSGLSAYLWYNITDNALTAFVSGGTPRFRITNGAIYSIGTDDGVTGTLAPGMTVTGGIITSAGSGSFVGTGANTFTGTQTVNAGASTPAITAQQTGSDASNTLTVRNAASATTFAVTGAGDVTATSFTGSGSGLTSIPAGQLTGTLDGGTW